MRVLIIRHGDPDYSIDGLTEKGKREAQLLSLRLQNEGISTIYCSPLGRAQLTAKPTAEKIGVEIITCDWLREFEARLEGIKGAPWNLPPRVWAADERAMDVSRWRDADLWKDTAVVDYFDMICAEFDKLLAAGDRPSQTAHLTMSPDRIHGRRLEFQYLKSGIPTATPLKLTP